MATPMSPESGWSVHVSEEEWSSLTVSINDVNVIGKHVKVDILKELASPDKDWLYKHPPLYLKHVFDIPDYIPEEQYKMYVLKKHGQGKIQH